MPKKNILIILVIVVVLAIAGIIYLQASKKVVSVWDDPAKVFNVEAPANFSDYQKERLAEKITEAKTLYETKKGETWTWIVVANMYKFVEDYDRAIGAYEKVLSIQPLEVISMGNLAHIYEKYQPNYEKAEYYYKRLLEASPTVPSYHIDYAKFCENKLNNPEKAEQAYLNGLQKTDNNPDVLVAIIRFYQSKNSTEKIFQYSKLLLKLNPNNELYKNDFGALVK